MRACVRACVRVRVRERETGALGRVGYVYADFLYTT